MLQDQYSFNDDYLFRHLHSGETARLREIDRGETITELYQNQDGVLVLVPHNEAVHGFEEVELTAMIATQEALIHAGGIVMGCFHNNKLIGIASVEQQRRGSTQQYCKMDILYTSRPYRGHRIALRLLERIKQIALDFGAQKLYISATPTMHTVDFYIRQGARLASEPDQTLVALEPLDIHLELVL